MPEVKMRRFGLKLLIATAMTVVLVASLRFQWNSSRHRQQERELSYLEGSHYNVEEGVEPLATFDGTPGIDNDSERVDQEEDSENMQDGNENSEMLTTGEGEGNSTQSEEFDEDGLETGEDGLETGEDGLETGEDGLENVEDGFGNGEDGVEDGEDGLDAEEDGFGNGEDGVDGEDGLETGKDGVETEEDVVETVEDGVETGGDGVGTEEEGVDTGEDLIEDNQDEEAAGGSILNMLEEGGGNSETEVASSLGNHQDGNSLQSTKDNDGDTPSYDDNDPNWRANKFADAVYNDEEEDDDNGAGDGITEDDNDNKDDSPNLYNDLKDNDVDENAEQPLSELKKTENMADKNPSMFTWLPFAKYFRLGNRRHNDELEDNEIYYDDNGKPVEESNINKNTSSFIDQGNFKEDKLNTFMQVVGDDYKINDDNETGEIDQGNGTKSQDFQNNSSTNELPFSVDGIDKANYDDLDDLAEKDSETQKNESEIVNGLADQITSSVQVTSNLATHLPANLGIFSLEETNPDGYAVSNLRDKGNNIAPYESPMTTESFGSPQLHVTHQNIQPIQPLQFQQKQLPNMRQLPTHQQLLLKALLPPRMFDIIMSPNLEQSYLKQFPARMQYFIHQNIHRIDQDIDPLTSNEPKFTTKEQPQISTLQTSGPLSVFRGLKNEEIESRDNFAIDNNDPNVESENYDNNDNFYEGDDNRIETDTYLQNDGAEEDDTITPVPDTAIYDNPRPLSDEQFALFRTRPYNTNPADENGVPVGDQGGQYDESRDYMGEAGMWPNQQMSKTGEGKEDETLICPRDVSLGKVTRQVTALVAFSDDGTLWVRRIIEQLTGIETDSIYNIMAQLKMGNVASVYQMGRKVVIESHIASEKNFERAVVVIKNPFAVDVHHKTFRPSSVDWQKSALWNRTYSTWLKSSLPLHVMTYEDLMEKPLTELMKLTEFLSGPDMTISYKCAMRVALDPPGMINDIRQITGIYHEDRRRISQNIDHLIRVAEITHPHIVKRLFSYKVSSDTLDNM